MNQTRRVAAMAALLAITACGANTASTVQPARTANNSGPALTAFRHGAEIASGTNFIVSDGHNHVAFPPGATYRRTADGLEVTFNGVTRTFSSSATVGIGAYHKYARATQ